MALFPAGFCFPWLLLSGLILIGAGLLAAGVIYVTNWLALIPWRRCKSKHWSEQARLLFPVRAAALSNLWTVPGINTLTVLLLWPDSSPLWLFTGMVSVLGAYAGTLPLDHEIFPRIPFRELLRQAAIGILLRFLIWFIFIGAAVFMPDEFDREALAIGGIVIVLSVLWSRGGLIWLGLRLGFFQIGTERLQKTAKDTAGKMKVPFRQVLLMRSPTAQAFALLNRRQLLFTVLIVNVVATAAFSFIESVLLSHNCVHSDEVTMVDLDSGREQVGVTRSRPELHFAGTSRWHSSVEVFQTITVPTG